MDKPVNQGLDEKLFNHIVKTNLATPYYQTLGIVMRVLAPGRAEMAVVTEARHINPLQRVHGGLISSLADAAMANAVRSLGYRGITVEFGISLMSEAPLNVELVGKGRVVKAGRNISFVEAVITAGDIPVAQSKGVFYNQGRLSLD